MKLIYRLLALMLCGTLICPLFGCGNTAQTQGSTQENSPSGTQNADTVSEEQLFEMLFDIRNQIALSLDMADTELEKMQQDYDYYVSFGSKSPIYRKGNLLVTIRTPEGLEYSFTVEEVGVRMKGNTSRTDFYNDREGIYNIIHLKLDFQETFDDEDYYGADAKTWEEEAREARKDRTFATLEKMDLRWNRCDDGSYLKEYFAYETYRAYGVPAPHTNLCSFDWAGIHMGVFTINEPVDKIFVEKYFPEEAQGGDLYKVGWAGQHNGSFTDTGSIGVEDEDAGAFFAYDLKTNKKTSAHESLKGFIAAMNAGGMTKERYAQLVDVENILAFSAVSYLLGNPDDMRNNYNNYYVYFRGDNGKAVFIPYDYDRCLGVTTHWNPTGDGVTSDNPFTDGLAAMDSAQKNPVLLYSVVKGGYFTREYAALLNTIAGGQWFTFENFAALYELAAANYADLSAPGKAFHNTQGLYMAFDLERTSDFASNGNISFREYLQAKLQTLNFYLGDLDRYADGTPTVKTAWYIRCDATDWQNDPDFAMEIVDGCPAMRVIVSGSMRLKVYHDATGKWYGAECVPESCTVPFESDGHTNIILGQGTYTITFDPETETITLEKEE